MPAPSDPLEPDAALSSYLASFDNAEYRARVGTLGLLRLFDPLQTALRAYERQVVAAARREGKSWEEIGDALGMSKQSAHQRWRHVG